MSTTRDATRPVRTGDAAGREAVLNLSLIHI